MPSAFLEKRLAKMVGITGGSRVVSYIAMDRTAKDSLTGEVNETLAYAGARVSLPALVDLSPSLATRQRFGLEENFDAYLVIAAETTADRKIQIRTGDAFILPHDTDLYYVQKVTKSYQSNNSFHGLLIAVGRKPGRY